MVSSSQKKAISIFQLIEPLLLFYEISFLNGNASSLLLTASEIKTYFSTQF